MGRPPEGEVAAVRSALLNAPATLDTDAPDGGAWSQADIDARAAIEALDAYRGQGT